MGATSHIDHFPPPPPGLPPSHQQQVPPLHSNETPIPETNISTFHPSSNAYNPANPHFAPPPDSELYDDYPPKPTQPHSTTTAAQPQVKPSTVDPGAHGAQGPAEKVGWAERLSALGAKAAQPINALANKLGSEAFLPTSMDKECEKAARILRGFCKDGIYADGDQQVPVAVEGGEQTTKTKPKPRTLLTIPSKVISRAVGLAIFTTARVGFNVSGATGSGVLIARLPDGRWSPPSGIQIHSLGAGFVIGADIYDCVVVINTKEALEAFTRTRVSLGSDLAVVAGPWGAGGSLDFAAPASERKDKKGKETEKPIDTQLQSPGFGGGPSPAVQPEVTTGVSTTTTVPQSTPQGSSKERKPSPLRQAIKLPTYSYVRSRGFYAGVQIDGTVITERKDANAIFYHEKLSVERIIKAEVPAGTWNGHAKGLFDVVKGAEGWRGQGTGTDHLNIPGNSAQATASPVPASNLGNRAGAAGGSDIFGATHSMQETSLGTAPSTSTGAVASGAVPPPLTKEQEASREAAAARAFYEPQSATLPGYSETATSSDLPPAYADNGVPRPGVSDSKTTHH